LAGKKRAEPNFGEVFGLPLWVMPHGEERALTFQNLVNDVKAGNESRRAPSMEPLPTSFAARVDYKE
jgi:hypothetical protein